MFYNVVGKIIRNEKLVFTVLPFISVALIFANSYILGSSLVGLPLLFFYLLVNGEILGRAFYGDENRFFRLVFGLFTFIALLSLGGFVAAVASRREIWYLLGLLLGAAASSVFNLFLVKYERVDQKSSLGIRALFKFSRVGVLYVIYVALLAASFLMLFNERSGWVLAQPSIWAVIPSTFLRLYFLATALLVGLVLLPGKVKVKLLLIVVHSTFSLLFVPIVLYPGVMSPEAWYDLGRARVVLDFVSLFYQSASTGLIGLVRGLNSLLKGFTLHVLIATFANTAEVDMYWSDVLLVPLMWGFFVPLTAFRLTESALKNKRVALLAAFITIPNLYFLAWGKLTVSNSLGYIFFVLFIYLSFRFISSNQIRVLLPLFITLAATASAHFLPMTMSISVIVLAFALKRYESFRLRSSRGAYFLLAVFFILSLSMEPLAVIGRGIALPMLGESTFNLSKMLNTSIWSLVFGLSADTPVQDAVLYNMIFPILGLIGFAFILRRKRNFNRTLCFLLFFVFVISIIDFRIDQYGVEGGLYGAGRLNFFRDIAAIPFVATVLWSTAKYLLGIRAKAPSGFRWKNALAVVLICIGLSAWVVATVYETYKIYTWGLMPTSFELLAIKYIDGHTDGRYVVFAPWDTESIAWGFIGYPYPAGKQYIGFPSYTKKPPSINEMYNQMKAYGADIGYVMLPSFRLSPANFGTIVNQASRTFGLFKVFTNDNGEIYIFDYKIPPLPRTADVTAFYWDTPPTFYVQNDLMRVVVNPASKTLDVQDFFGDLYESIKLNETIVGADSVGNLTAIEHFDTISNSWVEWSPTATIPTADQIQFRLRFERDSLIGALQKGVGSVQMQWESGRAFTLNLDVGSFKRIYIPGLIGGVDSYDAISREYGLLYTKSLTDNVSLQPAYTPNVNGPALTYNQIVKGGNLTLTEGYMSYDVYVSSAADTDQWSYIEVWLPDEVYGGTYPPFSYSLDGGNTWTYAPYNVDIESSVPVRTIGGTDVNWIFSLPRSVKEKPTEFKSYYSPLAAGGVPRLPENFTDSGGAQNRIIFGFYLPAQDKALVRLGVSIYEPRPFKTSYVFEDSDKIGYGLRRMTNNSITFYNLGPASYVGGVSFTSTPTSMTITQDENAIVTFISVSIPSNTAFSLLAAKGVDTTVDTNSDSIPDSIAG